MSWEKTSEEGFGGSSSAMIVLLVKQVHLQKEVGAEDISRGSRMNEAGAGGTGCGDEGDKGEEQRKGKDR